MKPIKFRIADASNIFIMGGQWAIIRFNKNGTIGRIKLNE